MNNKRKIFNTVFFSVIAMSVNYLINFFLTPFITENVGAEAYGFVSLSKNIISYAGIITIALNSYATRYIAVCYHRGEKQKSENYFNSVFYANIFLSCILFLIFFIGSINISHLLNVSNELVEQVKLLFVLSGVTFCITTSFSVFSSSAYIKNQLDKVNIFKGLSYIAEAFILILLFSLSNKYVWYVSLGTIVSSLILGISNLVIFKKCTPEINISAKNISISSIKELVGNGIWNSLNSLGNMLNSGLDLLITNLMLTSLEMGQLAIAKTISSMFYGLFQLIAQPFQPIFLKDYSEKNNEKLIKDLKISMICSGLFSNLAFAGFVGLGIEYYQLWIPSQDINLIWILTIITIFGSIIEGAVYPLYYIYTLTIKNKIPCIVTIIGGIANVIGMYLLIKYTNLGIYAVVITTAVIMTIINFIFNPLYMTKCLNVSKKTFYPYLFKHSLSCSIMIIVFYLIGKMNFRISWIYFVFKIILCIITGIIIHSSIFKINIIRLLKNVERGKTNEL